jgi:plastocyanin
MRAAAKFVLGLLALATAGSAAAPPLTLTARVELVPTPGEKKSDNRLHSSAGVVVWLSPLGPDPVAAELKSSDSPIRLVQKNKSFEPHLLVVPVGAVVEFPNHDPFFHNVFSLFEGKRFDLGLYEAGTTRNVRFDRKGISYIFCNIHPEMSAVIISLDTPYYGISNQQGEIVIPGVPAGRYQMHVFAEAALPDVLKALSRDVTVSENNSTLGLLRVPELSMVAKHKNLYGQDYPPPAPPNSAYDRP